MTTRTELLIRLAWFVLLWFGCYKILQRIHGGIHAKLDLMQKSLNYLIKERAVEKDSGPTDPGAQ